MASFFSGSATARPNPSLSTLSGTTLINNSSTQPQAMAGLFSQTATTTQAPGVSTQAPIFSNSAAQPAQQNGQSMQSTENEFRPGYFNSLLEKDKKRTREVEGGAGLGEIPSLQLGLGDIARRVRELGGSAPQTNGRRGGDSKAHYLLAASGVNPGTALRDLNSFTAQATATSHAPPPPEWDPDSHKYVEQLQQQSTLKMIAEGISRAQRDFDAYIEENVDINWDLQRKRIYEHFGLTPRAADSAAEGPGTSSPAGRGGFGRSSRRGRAGRNEISGPGSLGRSVFGTSGMQKSVIGTPGVGTANGALFGEALDKNGAASTAQDDRFLREKQAKFAEKVQGLNEARLAERPFPLLKEFADVEGQVGGDTPSQLVDAYKALVEIVKEDPSVADMTDPRTVRPRHYAEEYLDEAPNSSNAFRIRTRIIDGSRRALEKQFYNCLDQLVVRNPRDANLGGIPTVMNKVRAYIRIRNVRKDLMPDGMQLQLLNDDYCWALIFFLLRSGHIKEAAEYVSNNAVAFRNFDRNFVTYITSYASSSNRRLSRSQQDKINTEYQRNTRLAPENSMDPYKIACYKVVGRCELSKRSLDNISQGVEDWIWLQFSLAREVNRVEESANEVFGLEEVRETIREIGQRHFSKGAEGAGGYGTFFYLQILGGLFEQAVAYLWSYSYIAAVHFAIALDFYGLFRVSDFAASETELLTLNTKELAQINFGRMIGYYTRDFRTGNPVAATDYLTLICLNADQPGQIGKSQASLCHEALRELVLETREFAQLLGDVRSDGTRIKGAIELRLKLINLPDQDAFLRTVTLQAARVADDNGRTSDAVLLYHLAEDYDAVISIINRVLSDAIAIDLGGEQFRLQPLKPRSAPGAGQQQAPEGSSLSLAAVDDPAVLARNFISLYNTNAMYYQKIRPANRDACGVLLRLSEAKGRVENGQWAEALDIITSLSLLPLTASSALPVIRSAAQTLTSLPQTIARLVGPLLLWTMTCISRQREALGEGAGGFESDTRAAMREELVVKAKDLMVFAGLVKLRLQKGVWEGIVGGAAEVGVY